MTSKLIRDSICCVLSVLSLAVISSCAPVQTPPTGATHTTQEPKERSIEWGEALVEPVEVPDTPLAAQIQSQVPTVLPDDVLAVIGEYRGGLGYYIRAAAVSPSGDHIAVAGADEYLYVWDLSEDELVVEWKLPRAAVELKYAPDGESIAVISGMWRQHLSLRDPETGKLLWTLSGRYPDGEEGTELTFLSADFSPDGAFLATSSKSGIAWVWHADSGKLARRIDGVGRGRLAVSPDGDWLAIAGGTASFFRHTAEGASVIGTNAGAKVDLHASLVAWNQPDPEISSVPAPGGDFAGFSDDGARAIFDGVVEVAADDRGPHRAFFEVDLDTPERPEVLDVPPPDELPGESPELVRSRLSDDGRWLAAVFRGFEDATDVEKLVVYDLDDSLGEGRVVQSFDAPKYCVFAEAFFSPDSERLITALKPAPILGKPECADVVRRRRVEDWKLLEEIRTTPSDAPAAHLGFGRKRRVFRISRHDGSGEAYELPTLDRVREWTWPDDARPPRYDYIAGGTIAVAATLEDPDLPLQLDFHETASGRTVEFERLEAAGAGPIVAVSDDLNTVVTARCIDCQPGWSTIGLTLWQAGREEPIELVLPDGVDELRGVIRVAASSDGSRIVTFAVDSREAIIWDVDGDQVAARLGPDVGYGGNWRISPDGSVLALPLGDGSVLLWDLRR